MTPCTVIASCDRPAEYEVHALTTAGGIVTRHDACKVHAIALDDHGFIMRAVRLGGAADYMRAMREAKRAVGMCCDCASPAVPGMSRCERHRRLKRGRKMVRT